MMRKVWTIVLALGSLMLPTLPAPTRAQQTQSAIQSVINSDIISCGNGCITGAELNALLTSMNSATFQFTQFPNTFLAPQTFSAGALVPTQGLGDASSAAASTLFVSNAINTSIFSTPHTWTALQTFNGGALVLTRPPGDSTTNAASTAFVQGQTGGVVISGPAAAPDVPVASGSTSASWTTPSSWFDQAYCSTVGYIIVRFTGAWACSQSIPANVNWWGADPSGSTNSQPAFASAISALGASGGAVAYCGTYKFTATLVIPSNISMQGCGRGAAIVVGSGSANLPLFQVGNGSNNPSDVKIADTTFRYATAQTGGGAIWLRNNHNVRIERVVGDAGGGANAYAWLIMDGGAGQFISAIDSFEFTAGSYGIIVGLNSEAQDIFLNNGTIASATIAGISLQFAGGVYGDNVDVIGSATGMEIIPGNGQSVTGVNLTSYFLDTSTNNGLNIAPSGTGYAAYLQFNGFWGSSSTTSGSLTGNGVRIGAATTAVTFTGCNLLNNKKHGAQIDGGTNIAFVNCQVGANSQASAGAADGYHLAANVGHVSIIGGAAGVVYPALPSNPQGYGVNIASGTGADIVVMGVDVTGNLTGGILNGATGTGNSICNNPGMSCGYVSQINVQSFCASSCTSTAGPYVPATGMIYAIIECLGGGGAGGSITGQATLSSGSGGGGSGGYSRTLATASIIGSSLTITLGAGGTPAAAGNNNGGNGGTTTVATVTPVTLCGANGGQGGNFDNNQAGLGGSGGSAGTGNIIAAAGSTAETVVDILASAQALGKSGQGGISPWGSQGTNQTAFSSAQAGKAAAGYGAGGSGAAASASTNTAAGGAGAPGLVIITEYIHQ